jgi:sugar O-acyltransferase (sialic acid O-acetyltransferase NeuD family)
VLDNKTVIIGYGGHAYVVAESYIANGGNISFYADLKEASNNPFDLAYLGFESSPNFNGWDLSLNYILGIGDNNLREKVAKLVLSKSNILENVVDPHAIISKSANIGNGVFVSKGVYINAFSTIGNFTILNTGCIIEHECEIGAAAHIAPGAVLAGNVKVGDRAFIGANAVIKQGVVIGDDVIIGAGTVVLNNVENSSKLAGNPGRLLK